MEISLFKPSQSQEIIRLFTQTFTASENKSEGKLIGNLVKDLIESTEKQDLIGFVAMSKNTIIGSIFFSRFFLPLKQTVFILSPVCVATNFQGNGVGQKLIRFGLEHLKTKKVRLVLTYGDPNFYKKLGFRHISESVIKAPNKLSYPEGWLAQSLDGSKIKIVKGKTSCVKALNNQLYW